MNELSKSPSLNEFESILTCCIFAFIISNGMVVLSPVYGAVACLDCLVGKTLEDVQTFYKEYTSFTPLLPTSLTVLTQRPCMRPDRRPSGGLLLLATSSVRPFVSGTNPPSRKQSNAHVHTHPPRTFWLRGRTTRAGRGSQIRQ